MKNIFYLFGGIIMITMQIACDSFTRIIDEDYSDHEAKGVIFSVMTNADIRDTAFRSGNYYSTTVTDLYKNRIYVTNSVPPFYADFANDTYYKANINLETKGVEIPLKFIKENHAEQIRNSFYAVQDTLVPGAIYEINASFDPEVLQVQNFRRKKWMPVSAMDTMPAAISFELENATLEYPREDLSPDGGFVDIVINDESARHHTYQVAVSAVLKYNDGRESVSRLVHSYIEQPVENIDLDLFGSSRFNVFDGEELTSEGRKRIRFSFSSQFGPYKKDSSSILLVRLTTLSRHYAKFLKSSDQYSANDGNPFVEPVEIYTNVVNGYGIFALGARSYKEVEVK